MTAIDSSALLDEARCYACYVSASLAQLLNLALERRILLARSPTADVSGSGLLDYSKCHGCHGASIYDLMEIALLDQISQA